MMAPTATVLTVDAGHAAAPADATAPVLACQQLSRWHGEVIAVNDVTLELPPGITGLLGPNGSGKSTLLRLAVGLLRPSAGTIRVLGEDPWNNPGLLRRIGYLPEAPAPWQELTGSEAVERAALLSGMDAAAARKAAQAAIADTGLQDAKDRLVAGYSRGMQQRLKFAVATVHDPQVLILDEPLLGTDPIARRDLLTLMKRMAADGKSLLVSTHVLSDIEALTSRIALLNHGRLLAKGEVAHVRDLMDQVPRTVRLATPDPRRLGRDLWGWPEVLSIQAEPAAVVVRTSQAAAFYARLQQAILGDDLPVTAMTSPDDSVEAVFQHLVGGAA